MAGITCLQKQVKKIVEGGIIGLGHGQIAPIAQTTRKHRALPFLKRGSALLF